MSKETAVHKIARGEGKCADCYQGYTAVYVDPADKSKGGGSYPDHIELCKLHAAAPELLEALKDCATLEDGAMAFRSHEYAIKRLKAIQELAINAIARAEGEASHAE